MNERKQVEKAADDILYKKRLDWVIASVLDNPATHSWEIEVEIPSGPEVMFSVPKGSIEQVRDSITRQIEREMDRLKVVGR